MTRDADASFIPVGALIPPVPLTAPEVHSVLAALGRAEDVRVSPDGRRLALAGYGRNTIVLADLDVRLAGAEVVGDVRVDAAVSLRGDDIVEPHGVDFLDDTTIVVANRVTGVRTYRLPAARGAGNDFVPCAPGVTDAFRGLRQPGSVRVLPGADGWIGVRDPDAVHRVMDDETFRRGRNRAEEGGPKGLGHARAAEAWALGQTERLRAHGAEREPR